MRFLFISVAVLGIRGRTPQSTRTVPGPSRAPSAPRAARAPSARPRPWPAVPAHARSHRTLDSAHTSHDRTWPRLVSRGALHSQSVASGQVHTVAPCTVSRVVACDSFTPYSPVLGLATLLDTNAHATYKRTVSEPTCWLHHPFSVLLLYIGDTERSRRRLGHAPQPRLSLSLASASAHASRSARAFLAYNSAIWLASPS